MPPELLDAGVHVLQNACLHGFTVFKQKLEIDRSEQALDEIEKAFSAYVDPSV